MKIEKGLKYLEKEDLEKLPEDIKQSILKTLKAYSETYVSYEYGKYKEMPMIGIYSNYAPDHKFIGTVRAEDIYTLEERIKNYEETFGCTCYHLRSELKSKKDREEE